MLVIGDRGLTADKFPRALKAAAGGRHGVTRALHPGRPTVNHLFPLVGVGRGAAELDSDG